MERSAFIRFSSITVAFVVLIIGYIYFNEQSLISSGKSNAEIVAQQLRDGDTNGVKDKLDEFVGVVNPNDEEYRQAIISISYVDNLIENGAPLTFVEGELGKSVSGENRVYSAVYRVPAEQGGEDFLVIVMRREDNHWQLANTKLSATNPLAD